MNSATSLNPKAPRQSLSTWELPKLVQSVHAFRKPPRSAGIVRYHFPAILAFVLRSKLATAAQVRRRFAEQLPSDRTARRHLAELEAMGWLGVQHVTDCGPLFPKPYFITRLGLRQLRDALAKQGQRWESFTQDRKRTYGQTFFHVWHELATTEFLLSAWETAQRRPELELLTVERRSLTKHPAFEITKAGRRTRLQPDGLLLVRQHGGMICCLLETDTGVESLRQIERKLASYRVWAEAEQGQRFLRNLYQKHGAANPTSAFRLLFVCCSRAAINDTERTQALYRLACEQPSRLRNSLWFVSVDDLRRCKESTDLLEQRIWLRGRDADMLLPILTSGCGSATILERHSLFP